MMMIRNTFASATCLLLLLCLCQDVAAGPKGLENFPSGILDRLQSSFRLDPEQATNILGMIQGPEQARTEWWLTVDGAPIWGYAEDIGDGRSITAGLFGATFGAGYNDADGLWTAYFGHPVGSMSQSQIVAAIKGAQNDPRWQLGMFNSYIDLYWTPSWNLLAPLGYTSALTFGAILDTAMNAGMEDDDSRHWGAAHVIREAAKTQTTPGEAGFLTRFLQLRAQYPTANSGDIPKRIQSWKWLVDDGIMNMKDGDDMLAFYAYIPGETSPRQKGPRNSARTSTAATAQAATTRATTTPKTTTRATTAATTRATTKATTTAATTRATTAATTRATTAATTRATTTAATTRATTAARATTTAATTRAATTLRATTAATGRPTTTPCSDVPVRKWDEDVTEEQAVGEKESDNNNFEDADSDLMENGSISGRSVPLTSVVTMMLIASAASMVLSGLF